VNPQEASIFSDQYTWTIFNILRKAGARGLTSKEIHMHIEKNMRIPVSQSKVYGLLKRLYQQRWVHRYYDKDSEAQRNTIALDWGTILPNKEFFQVVTEKEKNYMTKKLFPVFLEFIAKTTRDLQEDSVAEKWLPQKGTNYYCKVCGKSHEAEEFFSCLLDITLAEFQISKEFMELLIKNRYAEEDILEITEEGYTPIQQSEKRVSKER
jgi:hypothetical protein